MHKTQFLLLSERVILKKGPIPPWPKSVHIYTFSTGLGTMFETSFLVGISLRVLTIYLCNKTFIAPAVSKTLSTDR